MASFLDLDDYLLILILLQLDVNVAEVLNARKICGSMNQASKDKTLWLHILRTLLSNKSIIIPPYIQPPEQPPESLRSSEIEAIVLRTRRLQHLYSRPDLYEFQPEISPQCITSLNIPQSVDWVELVNGKWLFVASSDRFVSKFSCWDMSLTTDASSMPLVECFLPAHVDSGRVEVRGDGVVIALGVGPNSSAVHLLTLSRHHLTGDLYFTELRRLPGFTHLQLLRGDFIVCGLRDDIAIPHLINWVTPTVYPLADKPSIQGSYVCLSVWCDHLLAFNSVGLTIFEMPSSGSGAPSNLHLIQTIKLVAKDRMGQLIEISCEQAAFDVPPPSDTHVSHTRTRSFVAFGTGIVYALHLKHNFAVPESNATQSFQLSTKKIAVNKSANFGGQWYQLLAGPSGNRIMWMSTAEQHPELQGQEQAPGLLSADVLELWRQCLDNINISEARKYFDKRLLLSWQPSAPVSLRAFPVFDFDDALGLVAIGNIFGELVVVDYAGIGTQTCWSIGQDILSSHDEHIYPPVAQKTLLPSLPEQIPRQPHGVPLPPYNDNILPWACTSTPTNLPSGYTADWSAWRSWMSWQGLPGDQAWLIQHAFGFLGQPQPLAYKSWTVFFMAGGLYFLLDNSDPDFVRLNCYDADTRWSDIVGGSAHMVLRLPPYRPGAYDQKCQYHDLILLEGLMMDPGRNRWIEQQEQGGKAHPRMLITPKEMTVLLSRSQNNDDQMTYKLK